MLKNSHSLQFFNGDPWGSSNGGPWEEL